VSFSLRKIDWRQPFRIAQRALLGPAVSELDPQASLETLLDKISGAGFKLAPGGQGGCGGPLLKAYGPSGPTEKNLSYIWKYNNPKTDAILFVTLSGDVTFEDGRPNNPKFSNASQIGLGLIIEKSGTWPLRKASFQDYIRVRGETAWYLMASIGSWKSPATQATRPRQWRWPARATQNISQANAA